MKVDPVTSAAMQAMDANARSTEWALEQAHLGERAARERLERRVDELERRLEDMMEANNLWCGL